MEGKMWKILAISFITISVILASTLIYIFTVGNEYIRQENECAVNVCGERYAFAYDPYGDICYCYDGNNLVKQEYIGG